MRKQTIARASVVLFTSALVACSGAEDTPGPASGSGGTSMTAGGSGGATGGSGPAQTGGTVSTGGSNQGVGGTNQGSGGATGATGGSSGATGGASGNAGATGTGGTTVVGNGDAGAGRPDASRTDASGPVAPPDGGARSEAGPVTTAPREIWVSPTGSDTNPGTVDAPMLTVCNTTAKVGACYKICPSSYSCPAAGGTIWMKGGTYKITTKIDIGATRPGVATGMMNLFAVAGERPIIDASGLDRAEVTKTGIGIHLKASYWHVKGIEVMNAPHNCIKVEGGFNTIENTVVHGCANTGITISVYDGTDMSAGPGTNNTILNCDSYGNIGLNNNGEDADGFGAKEQTGAGNVFRGCRSWNNADDGFDFYGWGSPITLTDCWAFENAKVGASGGDGNGFKLGLGPGGHTVTNGLSAYNVKTAYTSNGADKLSTCVNCRACSNGSVTGTGDHGISGTITNLSPCVDLTKAEGPRKADGSLPTL